MNDKYVPWFLVAMMFSMGVAGILIYLLMKRETTPTVLKEVKTVTAKPLDFKKTIIPKEFLTRAYTITDTITMLDERSQTNLPWTSFDLTNNGPDQVYFSINNYEMMEAPLPVGQSINVDLQQNEAIRKVYFKCDTGKTANILLYVVK